MRKLILISLAVLALTSCGPEASQLDLERENSDAKFKQSSQEYQALVGTYTGYAEYKGVQFASLKLDITLVTDQQPNQTQDGLWSPRLKAKFKFKSSTVGELAGTRFNSPDVSYKENEIVVMKLYFADSARIGAVAADVNLSVHGNTLVGFYDASDYIIMDEFPNDDIARFNVVLEKVVADAQQ